MDTTIEANPFDELPNISEYNKDYHRGLFELPPRPNDLWSTAALYAVSHWRPITSQRSTTDRAQRAGPVVRMEAVLGYNLSDWKQALIALFVAGYGPLAMQSPYIPGSRGRSLFSFLLSSSSQGDAFNVLGAYDFDCDPKAYFTELVLRAIEDVLATSQGLQVSEITAHRREAILHVARQVGLLVNACDWQFEWNGSVQTSGHVIADVRYRITALLTCGWARYEGDCSPLLQHWSGLVVKEDVAPDLPEARTVHSIRMWGQDILGRSEKVDNVNKLASCRINGKGNLVLTARDSSELPFLLVITIFGIQSAVSCKVEWKCKAAGHLTRLSIDKILAIRSCKSYGLLDDLVDPDV